MLTRHDTMKTWELYGSWNWAWWSFRIFNTSWFLNRVILGEIDAESCQRYNCLSPISLVYSTVCSILYGFMLETVDFETLSSLYRNWLPSNIKKILMPKNIQFSQRINFCFIRLNRFSTELHKNMIWERQPRK